MIQMGVDMNVLKARDLIAEVGPGADTGVEGGLQVGTGDVGGLGEPEGTKVHQVELIVTVVDGAGLTTGSTALAHPRVALVEGVGIHAVDPAGGDLLHTNGIGLQLVHEVAEQLGTEIEVHRGAVLGLDVEGHDLELVVLHGLLHDGVGVRHVGVEGGGLLGGGEEVDLGQIHGLAVLPRGLFKVEEEDLPVLGEGGQIQVDVLPVTAVGHAGGAGKALEIGGLTDGGGTEIGQAAAPEVIGADLQHHVGVLGGVGEDAVHGGHQLLQLQKDVGLGGARGGDRLGGHAEELALGVVHFKGDLTLGGAGHEGPRVIGGELVQIHRGHEDGSLGLGLGGLLSGLLGGSVGGGIRGDVSRLLGGGIGSSLGGGLGGSVGGRQRGGGHVSLAAVTGSQGQAQAQGQKPRQPQKSGKTLHKIPSFGKRLP